MQFTFDQDIDELDINIRNVSIVQEPDGTLVMYGLDNSNKNMGEGYGPLWTRQVNFRCRPDGIYRGLKWEPFDPQLTANPVEAELGIGFKNYPGQGAVGFANLQGRAENVVAAPVFGERAEAEFDEYPEVMVSVDQEHYTATFTITGDYDAYRIYVRSSTVIGYTYLNYVTYLNTYVFNRAAIETRQYEVSVLGYRDENVASLESPPIGFTL